MNWETDKLCIELSGNLDKYGIMSHIIKSFYEYGVSRSEKNNMTDRNFVHLNSRESCNTIPHCKIYPKFEYQSHLDKIRRTNVTENLEVSLRNDISLIIVFFLTIDVYDEIICTGKSKVEGYFGHEVIDLLFFEATKYASDIRTRCIVIWIGTRDCLSQESLFNNKTEELISNIYETRTKKRHIDRSCLDKCITNLLVNYSVDSFEAKNELEASQYLISIVSGLHEVQKRPISSKYKPKINSATNNNPWITQIMQIPGLSEDSARGLERIFNSPKELVRFIKDNLTEQELASSKSNLLFKSLNGYSNMLEIENSVWFNKLANVNYFCSKGFCNRKLGKARARKLVILYGNMSCPSKMIGDQVF